MNMVQKIKFVWNTGIILLLNLRCAIATLDMKKKAPVMLWMHCSSAVCNTQQLLKLYKQDFTFKLDI